jgi:hypothetical protein
MSLALRRPRRDRDDEGTGAAQTRRGTHVPLEGGVIPDPVSSATPGAGIPIVSPSVSDYSENGSAAAARADAEAEVGHGRRRSESRHRRTAGHGPSRVGFAVLRFAVPAVLLLALIALVLIASLISPTHTGPLPPGATLPLVIVAIPLVFAAALRLGLSSVGAVVAASLSAFLLPTASSDVVGVAEHVAVVLGLITVAIWPHNVRGTVRRYLAGGLAGAAIAASPLAIFAVAAVMAWLLSVTEDRGRRARALVGPTAVGLAVAAVGIAVLAVISWLDWTTWAGNVSFATIVVAMSPAFGIAGGVAADRSLAALGARSTRPLVLGSIGVVGLCLLLAATAGATLSQVRDRTLAAELRSEPGAPIPAATSAPLPSPAVNADTAEARERRVRDSAQLLLNPRLTVTDQARGLLEDGEVDRRILLVLGQLLSEHDLTVADFPQSGDEPVRRSLLVTEADGDALATGGASIPVLSAYLSGLTGDYAVETLAVDESGVLAVFPLIEDASDPAGAR